MVAIPRAAPHDRAVRIPAAGLALLVSIGCGRSSDPPAPSPGSAAPAAPAQQRAAEVVREESSGAGETRLFAGSVADLDGNGTLELVAGGFFTAKHGRRSTVLVYEQQGDGWVPMTEGSWNASAGSTIRNIEIADLDGDGRPEVVALGRVGVTSEKDAKARLAVFAVVNRKLVERAAVDWQSGTYTHGYGLAIGDLDGDGAPEIVSGGFLREGASEKGFVRVWSFATGALAQRAEIMLDGQGSSSMRINDLALGDLDGDRQPEIVVAGRHGPLTDGMHGRLDQRRELGDLAVLALAGDQLTIKARHAWVTGSSLRLRTVAVADLDGDRRDDLIVGGQYDAGGKVYLALFALDQGKLQVRDDASRSTAGEIKDLIVAGSGTDLRVITTGPTGKKPGRRGDVGVWRVERGKLVRDDNVVSRHGEETRVRAVVLVPGAHGSTVLTIGHARNATTMVGQVLRWKLSGVPEQL